MHTSVMVYVKDIINRYGLAPCLNVLEIGSYDVNGSVRLLFNTSRYLGVDLRDGPGVDLVAHSHNLHMLDNNTYDVVVSTEMLEHDGKPWHTVREMARLVKPEGYVIVTARGFDERGCFPLHDFPADHWRYSVSGMRELLEDFGLRVVSLREDPEEPGVFAMARKP